jgi:GntR family transcriptional regulator
VSAPRTARYEEIAEYLRTLVADARPGDRLPSDAELCERFDVSRMTARQAVQTLANEHLLYRRRGKGTFVSARPVARVLGSPLSFSVSTRRRGLKPSSRLLHAGMIPPTQDHLAALQLQGEPELVLVERLRLADDVPMAIERAVITPACAFVLEGDLVSGSLHDAFEAHGRTPSTAFARVTSRNATPRERRLLDLSSDGTVLSEARTIVDDDNIPLEHTETIYAAERYVFEAVLRRDEGPLDAG